MCDTESSKTDFISKEVLEKKASDETLGWIITVFKTNVTGLRYLCRFMSVQTMTSVY